MFCRECGASIDEDASYCVYCGARVGDVSEVDTARETTVSSASNGGGSYHGSAPIKPARKRRHAAGVGIWIFAVVLACVITFGPMVYFSYARGATHGKQLVSVTEVSDSPATVSAEPRSAESERIDRSPLRPEETSGYLNDNSAEAKHVYSAYDAIPSAKTGKYGFILSAVSFHRYTREELELLSQEDLRIASNEIYARYGRMFNDASLQEYFNSKGWYTPLYDPETFDAMPDPLSEIEMANEQLVLSMRDDR